MKLSGLIKTVKVVSIKGSTSIDVTDVCYDSSKAMAGSCFVAVKGTNVDGHNFISQAIKRGAKVIVSEKEIEEDVANVVVENTSLALAQISSAFFGHPSRDMRIVGVTGTNGKTTISYLCEAVLKEAGRNVGVSGTINWRYNKKEHPAQNTTPMSYDLQKNLAEMRDGHVADVVMEVSSHALDQERVSSLDFDVVAFTNLTQDHLDYHKNFEGYFEAKKHLFCELLPKSSKTKKCAVINIDDKYGKRILDSLRHEDSPTRQPANLLTYGFDGAADVKVVDVASSIEGNKMTLETPWGSFGLASHLKGKFNVSNIMATVCVMGSLGISVDVIKKGIEKFRFVPGRMEDVPNEKGIAVFVDYAHTPDALKNVLETLKDIATGQIITVFGCGGDRDRTKRPLMGEVSALLSDVVIVTSDNPRTEDPIVIINEILPGIKKAKCKKFFMEPDRRKAIELSLSEAKKGDVVLIAGKGHEAYQIIGKEVREFDDRDEVKRILG